MKKFLTALVIFAPLSTSIASNIGYFSSVIYGTPLIYNNSSVKDNGYFTGVYFSYKTLNLLNLFETAIDHTYIKYKDNTHLNQNDFTFAYTNYMIREIKLKVGAHYISSDDKNTDKGFVIFGEITKYRLYQWNYGLEMYFSRYKDYPTIKNKGLNVYQINPKFGFYLGNYYKGGRYYIQIKPYYIHLSEDLTGVNKNSFSTEGLLSYFIKNWTISLKGYVGDQAFPVRDGGFTVYNLSEKRKYGFGGSVKYILSRNFSLTLSAFRDYFNDIGTNKTASTTTAILILGASF